MLCEGSLRLRSQQRLKLREKRFWERKFKLCDSLVKCSSLGFGVVGFPVLRQIKTNLEGGPVLYMTRESCPWAFIWKDKVPPLRGKFRSKDKKACRSTKEIGEEEEAVNMSEHCHCTASLTDRDDGSFARCSTEYPL